MLNLDLDAKQIFVRHKEINCLVNESNNDRGGEKNIKMTFDI